MKHDEAPVERDCENKDDVGREGCLEQRKVELMLMGEICGVQGKQNRRNSGTQQLNSGGARKRDNRFIIIYAVSCGFDV